MDGYIRHKRKNGRIYDWSSKLYIPVPLGTKNEFVKVARLNRLSQAELGAVIVMHYLANLELAKLAIAAYKAAEEQRRVKELESIKSDSQIEKADRTFGGKFKSSFPEYE